MATVRQRQNARARQRLARIRLANPKALPHVTVGPHGGFSHAERVRIGKAVRALPASTKAKPKPKPKPYNPLAPLSGKSFGKEVRAAANLQYNPQINQVKSDISDQDKHTDLVGSAYDQYKAALEKALADTNAAYSAATTDANTRLGTAYNQDVASAQTEEGKQAAAAERALSNSALTNLSTTAASAKDRGGQGVANSILAKTEALNRESDARKKLTTSLGQLKNQKGQFKVSERAKLRSDERTYALARKEFGLKKADTESVINTRKAQVSADKQKANAQVLVAKLYASADKAKARATIRVAKLQLKKGKIDQHQYNTITNIYKGLPKKGQPGGVGKNGKPKAPKGSGPGGTYAPWERDDINRALGGFNSNNYNPTQRERALQKAAAAGIPERLALVAWRRYVKRYTSEGKRPDTAGNPNVSGKN